MTLKPDEMKPWQFGYDVVLLKGYEKLWEKYNYYSLSTFTKMSKNFIAQGLYEKTLKIYTNPFECGMMIHRAKVRTPITMHGDVVIGYKEPGDFVVTKMFGDYEGRITEFNKLRSNGCWVYVWAEDKEERSFVESLGFSYVGGKITTYGEVYAIYFRDAEIALYSREHPKVEPVEMISIKKMNVPDKTLTSCVVAAKLRDKNLLFTNHYSNYNKDKAWSALSLRGYSPDMEFITKPSEMSKKWAQDNLGKTFELQDTYLRKEFIETEVFLTPFEGAEIHRIRFMKLAPGGGELQRHTDQVDKDAGNNIGQIARFHFPIVTNDKMMFSVWSPDGTRNDVHMKVGECFLLDTRKPHMAVNNGDQDRIHLVIDVKVNQKVKELILS